MTNRDQTSQRLALQIFDLLKRTWIQSQREKFKGGYDLSESEFLTLDALEGRDESLTVGELRRYVGVLPAQMSRIIKALEQRYDEKLVVCSINPDDKRRIDVALTPKGRRAVKAYRDAKVRSTFEAIRSLSDRDLAAFEKLLDKIEASMNGGG